MDETINQIHISQVKLTHTQIIQGNRSVNTETQQLLDHMFRFLLNLLLSLSLWLVCVIADLISQDHRSKEGTTKIQGSDILRYVIHSFFGGKFNDCNLGKASCPVLFCSRSRWIQGDQFMSAFTDLSNNKIGDHTGDMNCLGFLLSIFLQPTYFHLNLVSEFVGDPSRLSGS